MLNPIAPIITTFTPAVNSECRVEVGVSNKMYNILEVGVFLKASDFTNQRHLSRRL